MCVSTSFVDQILNQEIVKHIHYTNCAYKINIYFKIYHCIIAVVK
jgi:hypothetical protein